MLILLVVIAFFLIVFAASAIRIVRPYERGLIERLGKFKREVGSGLHFIIPFFERMIRVDMREKVIDVPPQEVITKDNVVVTVDAVIYYEVTDAYRVIYNVRNFEVATIKLAQTNLRNVIGELELDQTLTSREQINAKLRAVLDEATDKWGVRITRVEIKKIDPPQDIMEAMSKQMKAERTKRAAILEAEGIKQAQILKAEGERNAAILRAEGQAEAIRKVAEANKYKVIVEAEGQAEAILKIFNAIHEGKPTGDLITIRYLEALKEIANGKATKIFLPMEASSILASLGAISEIFKKEEGKQEE
ncbi:MAG: SPFH/Band 7/PHB domain protein [Thermotogaceae bacterium]|nr:SPFH/Band 7/PHB domain protein [Thermotogaceae bacterium]RKX41379.1 MAG: SPFH/Band 7/PHB domain protein [Thermotogota bacterium]RKX57105.1 MAG: SPFH/Band 7/PHB domain protein [Thermotoga sp.]HDG61647.1 SPFH/Band 7/PHB domain protein [Thermotoga sp.]